jgi:hypothetical protein
MIDKELRALKRLIKKLSAVRQVLSNDERQWLDRFITGGAIEAPEVTGHMISQTSAPRPAITFDERTASYTLNDKI